MVMVYGESHAPAVMLFSPGLGQEKTTFAASDGYDFGGPFSLQLSADEEGKIVMCGTDAVGVAFHAELDAHPFAGAPVYFKAGAYIDLQQDATPSPNASAIVTHHHITLVTDTYLRCPASRGGPPVGTFVLLGSYSLLALFLVLLLRRHGPSYIRAESAGGVPGCRAASTPPAGSKLPEQAAARRRVEVLALLDGMLALCLLITPLVTAYLDPWTPESAPRLLGRLRSDWLLVVPPLLSLARLVYFHCLRTNSLDGAGYPEMCACLGVCLAANLFIVLTLAFVTVARLEDVHFYDARESMVAQRGLLGDLPFVLQLGSQATLICIQAGECIVALAAGKIGALAKLHAAATATAPHAPPACGVHAVSGEEAAAPLAHTRSGRVRWVRDSIDQFDFDLLLDGGGGRDRPTPSVAGYSLDTSALPSVRQSFASVSESAFSPLADGKQPADEAEETLTAHTAHTALLEDVVGDACHAGERLATLPPPPERPSLMPPRPAAGDSAGSDTVLPSYSRIRPSEDALVACIADMSHTPRPPPADGLSRANVLMPPARGKAGWGNVRFLSRGIRAAWARFVIAYAAIGLSVALYYLVLDDAIWPAIVDREHVYWIWADGEGERGWLNDPSFLCRVGVVVPCHKSADEIGCTLASLLRYFEPQHIVVCDNGNNLTPDAQDGGATKRAVEAAYRKYVCSLPEHRAATKRPIHYVFIPEGHKTQALCVGALRLSRLHTVLPDGTRLQAINYMMHIDDDTILSDRMVFDETLFHKDPKLAAVAFPRISPQTNLVTASVDFWYKKADHMGWCQAQATGTRPYIPGPCGLWRLKVYLAMIAKHPFLPFGEDIFGSYHALCLHERRYRFTSEMRCHVTTFAPPVLVQRWLPSSISSCCSTAGPTAGPGRVQGYGAASLWKQRAHRWTVSGLRVLPLNVYCFFFYRGSRTWTGALMYRLFRLREYKMIFFQLFLYPYVAYQLAAASTWQQKADGLLIFVGIKAGLIAIDTLRSAFINYVCWRHRPDVQVSLTVVLLSGWLDLFFSFCATFGRWKCLLFYIPLVPMRTGLVKDLHSSTAVDGA